MNKSRIALILLSAMSVMLLYSAVVLYVVQKNERQERIALQNRFDAILEAKEGVEKNLKDVEIENAQMKVALKSEEEKIGMVSKQLEESKSAHKDSLAKLEEKEVEIKRINQELEIQKVKKNELIKRLEKLNQEYAAVKAQYENTLQTQGAQKEPSLSTEKDEVSLGTIVINRRSK